MKSLDFGRNALYICVAAALLQGCGGSQPPIAAPGVAEQSPAHARSKSLVYVASEKGTCYNFFSAGPCHGVVFVLTYPQGKHLGRWIGKENTAVEGACADQDGNVFVLWITDSGPEILEFAHGGTHPIKKLSIPVSNGLPDSCSSDPTTGNLAVAVTIPFKGDGSLFVYPDASGTPKQYNDVHVSISSVGYDNQGNAFVDGSGGFFELPRGKSSFKRIKLSAYGDATGPVQWDGTYITKGNANQIDRYDVSGRRGKYVGSTVLSSPTSPLCCQIWIAGAVVLGVYFKQYVGTSTLGIWHYPAGGSPFAKISLGRYAYGDMNSPHVFAVMSPASSR